ncbi:MAG: 50S ribosomal protein L25 [Candidatus Dormibacteraeota bacterium]|nr:50S ribosomal protein L25 [Candidatus Dormibacteraeota bacterium]MBO0762035.1 50S ribosomal protein L25 [Candidatus Dormibacteraeota bacterium]
MELNATPREPHGKSARRLRPDGKLPAIVYGQGHNPVPLTLDSYEFGRVLARAGRTQLVDLVVDGKRPRKVLIKDVQISQRRNAPVHVDFHQVNLRDQIQVDIPISVVGEAPAVKAGLGDLLPLVHTLTVECLPTDIPEYVEVDVSGLEEADQGVKVAEVTLPPGVVAAVDGEEMLVKVQPSRLAAEVAAEEAAEAEEAAAEAPEPAEAAEPVGAEAESEETEAEQ